MNNPTSVVVANLKANKKWEEIVTWLNTVAPALQNFRGTAIFCPSHPFLASAKEKIDASGWPMKLGSQDISKFESGAYTGEVTANQIANLVEYAIIGHSERRKNLKEDDKSLAEKVLKAKSANIEPIYCVQNEQTPIPEKVAIVAYEPVFAIGTGNPDTPENIEKIAGVIKNTGIELVLYGGSVDANNVKSFVTNQSVDGVLVGATNSLDPHKFVAIIDALK